VDDENSLNRDNKNNINNIQNNHSSEKTDNPSRLYIRHDINQKLVNDQKNVLADKNRQFTLNKYFSVLGIAILLYMCCVCITKVSIVEVIDLEVPLLVLASLIITYFCENINSIIIYVAYFVIIALMHLLISPQIAFILAFPLLSQIVIDCINKIYTNDKDYQVEVSLD